MGTRRIDIKRKGAELLKKEKNKTTSGFRCTKSPNFKLCINSFTVGQERSCFILRFTKVMKLLQVLFRKHQNYSSFCWGLLLDITYKI